MCNINTSCDCGCNQEKISTLDYFLNKQKKEKQDFVNNLKSEPPFLCDFKVGDKVTFINDYEIEFPDHIVVGFGYDDLIFNNRFIFIDTDSYWFPVRADQLKKSN